MAEQSDKPIATSSLDRHGRRDAVAEGGTGTTCVDQAEQHDARRRHYGTCQQFRFREEHLYTAYVSTASAAAARMYDGGVAGASGGGFIGAADGESPHRRYTAGSGAVHVQCGMSTLSHLAGDVGV